MDACCQPWTCGSRTRTQHFVDLTGHRDLFYLHLRGEKAGDRNALQYVPKHGELRNHTRENFCCESGRALDRLPRGVVEHSLEIFQTRLGAHVCNVLWQEVELDGLQRPFQPLLLCGRPHRHSGVLLIEPCAFQQCMTFSFLLQTYNQSQCNKRNIQKAISGNKMLHFYQHSPRMIPEGINPELHRMFITAEKYEPSDSRKLSRGRPSSLHHKSALFSCVTGKRIMVFSVSTLQAAISCCYLTAYQKCLLTSVWV